MNGHWTPSSTHPPTVSLTTENLQGSSYASLPKEPGAYEDFNYSADFSFGELFETTPTARTPLLGPAHTSASTFNPFDPAQLGFGDPFSPSFMPHTSTSTSTSAPPLLSPPQQLLMSPVLPSHSQSQRAPTPTPTPLLNAGESALFSSFLAGVGGPDSAFLFEPKLPPGMPSPPSELVRGETGEERRERDRLGEEVRSLSLSAAATSRGWHPNLLSSSQPSSAGPQDVHFAHPPAPDLIKSEFNSSSPQPPHAHPHPYPNGHNASTSRTRGTTRANEEQATGGRGHKLHKSTHQHPPPDQDEDQGDTFMKEDEDDELGVPTRRRLSRSATISRRRQSSTARPAAHQQPIQAPPAQPPSASAGPLLGGVAARARSDSSSSLGASQSGPAGGLGGEKRAPLSESQKRENHILSEQRRRNQIKVGFASLVELLGAGEHVSGIAVQPAAEGDKGKGKKGRGRGRKGDVGGGASKSVVLMKAARYVSWLERGNEAIEEEIRRVEALLGRM